MSCCLLAAVFRLTAKISFDRLPLPVQMEGGLHSDEGEGIDFSARRDSLSILTLGLKVFPERRFCFLVFPFHLRASKTMRFLLNLGNCRGKCIGLVFLPAPKTVGGCPTLNHKR